MKKILVTSTAAILMVLSTLATSTAAEVKTATKPYPLDKCIVSDEKLGEMGKPFVFVHEGQEIKLCCKSCQKDFNKEPGKYLKKLTAVPQPDKK